MPNSLVSFSAGNAVSPVTAPFSPQIETPIVPPVNQTPVQVETIEAANPADNVVPFNTPITPPKPSPEPQKFVPLNIQPDVPIHDLYNRPKEIPTEETAQPDISANGVPISLLPQPVKVEKRALLITVLMIFLSGLSLIEVVKAVIMAVRLVSIEFPIVESVLHAGQLTEGVFFRLCIKTGFIILAAILSTFAVFFPWTGNRVNHLKQLISQIGLVGLVFILLAVSYTLQYVEPHVAM